ncbi:dynein regulatory complex subunit 2-like [Corythoichthys intestinalis]|uniref:dynein regulatory complex subunit 2-like n=1 Tax=Corythoichthys intestinalis TaxID=161448 RepID=UPI0025A50F40|nr:dynein regulatory complex subunit 2-like [Corythoichthys intestinalis]XP_061814080.1 dynein regulatory complex subunit 2-like [Nerophis lumbriciformis]
MPKKKGKKGKRKGDDPALRPQIMRDKLKKETDYIAVNSIKLKDTYRVGLRANRCEEIKEELIALRRTFERRDPDLNHAVENFTCSVEKMERLSAQAWRVHYEHVDRLRNIQKKRLRFLQEQWDMGQDVFDNKLKLLSQKTATYFLQSRVGFKETVRHLEHHHQQALATVHMLYNEPMVAHSVYEKMKAFEVEERFLDLNVKVLKNQKADNRYLYDMEKVEDMEDKKKVSVTTAKKSVALYNTILEAQSRLEATEKRNSDMTSKLTEARNDANAKIHMLLSQMASNRVPIQIMMNKMSVNSNAAANGLRLIIAKGARLLKVAEMCCHLEAIQKEAQASVQKVAPDFETQPVKPSQMYEFPELMKRYNNAQLHRDALKRRFEKLQLENQQLWLLKQQRLEAKTVNPDTHKGPTNPLKVNMAPIMEDGTHIQRHSVVEGVQALKLLAINQ